jgi:transposase
MTYRQRDVVEKSFDDLKNELDMKRIHCHSDETMDGKMFVAFFALIMRSCMQNKLRTYLGEIGLPFSSVLKELRKIKYVCTRDGKRLLSPITKKQRDILNACGLSAEDLSTWLTASCIV